MLEQQQHVATCIVALQHLLEPLCRDIETDLRLHIHMHLQLAERNPFKVPLKDLSAFLKLRPIRFFDRFINVKGDDTRPVSVYHAHMYRDVWQ